MNNNNRARQKFSNKGKHTNWAPHGNHSGFQSIRFYSNTKVWQSQPNNNQPRPICQLCDKPGHSAKTCRSLPPSFSAPQANFSQANNGFNPNSTWFVDSGASHHITSDLQTLSVHFEYGGNDDIIIGNGNSIPISHIGSTTLAASESIFQLRNVLCAPYIKHILLSVSQFCNHNSTSIEFFPDCFVVKDLSMGASLLQGQNKGHVC